MKNKKNIFFQKIFSRQIFRFLASGVLNTLVSYIAYLLTIKLTSPDMYVLGNIMGFIFGTLNAYIWNSKFVFEKRNNNKELNIRHIFKTYLSYGLTFIINTFMLIIFVEYIHIPKTVAPLVNALFIFILNFMLNKFWVYKEKKVHNNDF